MINFFINGTIFTKKIQQIKIYIIYFLFTNLKNVSQIMNLFVLHFYPFYFTICIAKCSAITQFLYILEYFLLPLTPGLCIYSIEIPVIPLSSLYLRTTGCLKISFLLSLNSIIYCIINFTRYPKC